MRTFFIIFILASTLLAQERGRPAAPAIEMGAREGHWYASTRVSRPGAEAVQVFLADLRLPEGAELSLYEVDALGGKGQRRVTYTGTGPAAGAGFWSEAIHGSTVILEVVYADKAGEILPFTINHIREIQKEELEAPKVLRAATEDLPLFEGDILVGPVDQEVRRGAMAMTPSRYRWPNGILPYVIDPALPNQQRIHDAIAHWNSQLANHLKLTPRTSEANWVTFTPGNGCSSYIGNISGAEQPIHIGDWCSWGNVVHEIGHAAGLFHEHGREDRDGHISIQWHNLQLDTARHFSQYISRSDDVGAYDYSSIMHYPSTAFSGNGQPTILTIPPGISIGQRVALSAGDVAGVRSMYPASTHPAPAPPAPAPTTSTPPQPAAVQVTMDTNPPGLALIVDGESAVAPIVRSWIPGSLHTISAPSVNSDSTRHTFASWSDGGSQEHTLTAPSLPSTITATFGTQYHVTAASSDTGLGLVSLSPDSADGFYAKGSAVTLHADGIGSGCLAGWSGITAPPASPLQVTVSQPYSVTASFQTGAVSVSPSVVEVPWSGGTYEVNVTANTGCAWTAAESTNWMTIRSGAGTGSGTVRFSVGWRISRAGRIGSVRIGNATVTVVQSGY